MALARPTPERMTMTLADFLAWEEEREERYEFLGGDVVAMAGGTAAHNTITLNVAGALRAHLRGSGCRTFAGDVKVVSPSKQSMYPDVVVQCLPVGDRDTRLTAPVAVIEVLSPSTEGHDRGRKWEACRRVPDLRHYVLIAQDRPLVEVFDREEDGVWRFREVAGPDAVLVLDALGAALPLAAVYEDVAFDREAPADAPAGG